MYFSCRRLALAGAILVCAIPPASAQSLKLAFHNGHVDLSAQNVPVRTILAEWSRVGGTRIVNGERVGGLPLTLQLNDVPERTAIEILLRSVSGYMVGPRLTPAAGLSAFQSILIVPTSSPAPPPAAVRQAIAPPQPTIPQIDPNDPEENPATDIAPGQQGPGRQPPGRFRRPLVYPQSNRPPGGIVTGNGAVQVQPPPDDQPDEDKPVTPPNPFGIGPGGTSARPGVVIPAQQPGQQQPPRPNGDPEP
ncbi:MAG TPA: hypothetical protein VG871_07860 [Vicinamibacterales bacterium]|nr:hypothetical protein [Vicinamibacterales bacterium]